MENFEQPLDIERKERFGKNVQVKMLFMRHGEKASQAGLLTEDGKNKLREKFKQYADSSDRIKLSTANVGRNIQTLNIISESIDPEKTGVSYVDTAFGYFPERIGGITTHQDEVDLSDSFVDRLYEEAHERGENGLVQFYIDFCEERPDEGTISPKEMASKIAKRVLLQAKMAKRLYSNSKVDFIQVTGPTPFFPFLKEAIGEQVEEDPVNPDGTNFTEKVGGIWDFAEGVTIESDTDELGNLLPIKIAFRGKEYFTDLEKLKELAKSEDIKPRKYKLTEKID